MFLTYIYMLLFCTSLTTRNGEGYQLNATKISKQLIKMKLDLKDWSEKTLTKDDWNFSAYTKLPKSALSRIFQWEIDRELGSGKGPFGKDPKNKKWLAQVAKSKNYTNLPSATVTSSSGATHKTGKGDALTMGNGSTLHMFQINWYCSQQELVDAFSDWLEDHHDTPFTTFPTNSRGRPRHQYTLLEKISIHRFHKVGYSGGPKFFRENKKDAFRRNLKRINWTLAQREINRLLRQRAKELARISKAAGKDWKKLLYS